MNIKDTKKSNSDVKHELRNALTPVIGYSELLIAKVTKDGGTSDVKEIKEMLQKIIDQSFRMKELLDQL